MLAESCTQPLWQGFLRRANSASLWLYITASLIIAARVYLQSYRFWHSFYIRNEFWAVCWPQTVLVFFVFCCTDWSFLPSSSVLTSDTDIIMWNQPSLPCLIFKDRFRSSKKSQLSNSCSLVLRLYHTHTHADLTFCSHYLQPFTIQRAELMLFQSGWHLSRFPRLQMLLTTWTACNEPKTMLHCWLDDIK